METTRIITTIEELAEFANDFLEKLAVSEKEATIVALHGDLGVGKTAFVKEVGKLLGIEDVITSPTFTIMRQYDTDGDTFESLVHIDAYRLESDAELGPLKISEMLQQPRTLICIEWAERLTSVLPENIVHLSLSINEDHSRTVTLGQNGRA